MTAADPNVTGEPDELPVPPHLRSARRVLLEGIRMSPELRRGIAFTVAVSLLAAAGALLVPIVVQQIFDHGFRGGFRPAFVFGLSAAAGLLIVLAYLAEREATRRITRASEEALAQLRVRAFAHIHQLSIAVQSQERRGVFVGRVTADVDTLSQFTEWGGIAWIVSGAQILGALAIMLVYSWQLTIPVVILGMLIQKHLVKGFSFGTIKK